MVDFTRDANAIKETDILFDCTNCGKSLAIDYRGAGLSIPCTDCGQYVNVPIPEGMEIADLDSSDDEQEIRKIRILNLRKSLGEAEGRIAELESRIGQATRGPVISGDGAGSQDQLGAIAEQMDALQRHLQDATDALAKLADAVRELSPPAE